VATNECRFFLLPKTMHGRKVKAARVVDKENILNNLKEHVTLPENSPQEALCLMYLSVMHGKRVRVRVQGNTT
jgi:hypothetical protein